MQISSSACCNGQADINRMVSTWYTRVCPSELCASSGKYLSVTLSLNLNFECHVLTELYKGREWFFCQQSFLFRSVHHAGKFWSDVRCFPHSADQSICSGCFHPGCDFIVLSCCGFCSSSITTSLFSRKHLLTAFQLSYHLYAPLGPHRENLMAYQRTTHDFFIPDHLREEMQRKSEASLQTFSSKLYGSHGSRQRY